MTISLLHFNPLTGTSASITATGGPCVGGYVNHSWRSVGACATQGLFTNPWYADFAKNKLQQGTSARDIINELTALDSGHSQRQCLVMDQNGASAALNGSDNIAYIGHLSYPTIAVAGNMLEGRQVLKQFSRVFIEQTAINSQAVLEHIEAPQYKPDYEATLPDALISALEAALSAGGDKRGTVSASLRIEFAHFAPIDIRIDWAKADLIEELRFVLAKVRERSFQAFLSELPRQVDH